ncbi:MAG TPA: AAA family ATPase [Chloroflexota bacterium]|nr:AAA family ATPase [Chloroflexota bacterium]
MDDVEPVPDYARIWPVAVVPGDDLVGREPVLRDIISNIRSGRSVLLAAPRRLGKTSVAQEALRRLSDAGATVASIDFLRITSRRALADRLIEQLLAHSHSIRDRLVRRAGRAVGQQLRHLKPHWALAQLEFGISFEDEDEESLLEKAFQLAPKLAEKDKSHVVILMDEFQEAGSNLGREIYGLLRSYFQEQPDVQQIFLGSQESMLRSLFNRPNAPLLRHAVEVPLPPIAPEAWRSYLARKFAEASEHLKPVLIPQILEATGGHPADTMEVCRQLSILDESGQLDNELDDAVVPLAVELAHIGLAPVFEQLWASLGSVAYTRAVAARLASGEPPYSAAQRGRDIPHQMIRRALTALVDKGIVARTQRSSYVFREPMFERYVRGLTSGYLAITRSG